MNETLGLVTDTITFSNVDGPGNRFVVFLQGCNFDCIACHNPYTIGTCDDCGLCVDACPSSALSIGSEGRVHWSQPACTGSDNCIAVCPRDATPKARWRSVADLVAEIGRAAPYLSGITVSGGEATGQAAFVKALFAAVKRSTQLGGLTTFVDSNGATDLGTWRELAPVMDGAMLDLKCLDDTIHRSMTGQSNAPVLRSIVDLHERGLLYEVRLLLVPGVNDDLALVARTGEWLAAIDPDMRVKVIGFRCHGVRPTTMIRREPTVEELDERAGVLASAGLRQLCVV
jgi:pyruvate formate lyase activating enzyme